VPLAILFGLQQTVMYIQTPQIYINDYISYNIINIIYHTHLTIPSANQFQNTYFFVLTFSNNIIVESFSHYCVKYFYAARFIYFYVLFLSYILYNTSIIYYIWLMLLEYLYKIITWQENDFKSRISVGVCQ